MTVERKSAALGCARFKGAHTFDRIAAAISQTHAQYGIENKVVKTCTDNESNMLKAFSESEKAKAKKAAAVSEVEESHSEAENEADQGSELEEQGTGESEQVFDCAGDILDSDSAESTVLLPPHMRCCSHTFNLVATTDADKALLVPAYKKLFRSSMAKASAIWNATSRSTKAADAAFDLVGHRFSVPCPTRWNSYYDSVTKLIRPTAESKLTEVCAALSLPAFLQQELSFLHEYLSLMGPIAAALDVLQGDTEACLGFVLPTLHKLKSKLNAVPITMTKPLHAALQAGTDKRIGHFFDDSEFLIATSSHPKFKLNWVENPEVKLRCSMLLKKAVEETQHEADIDRMTAPVDSSGTSQRDESTMAASTTATGTSDDFFGDFDTTQAEQEDQHFRHLNDTSREINMLDKYPRVKAVFIHYNTTLPSSASVERLFSNALMLLLF